MTQMKENEAIIQKNNVFLNNLFYSNEPVTRDEYVSNLRSMNIILTNIILHNY